MHVKYKYVIILLSFGLQIRYLLSLKVSIFTAYALAQNLTDAFFCSSCTG